MKEAEMEDEFGDLDLTLDLPAELAPPSPRPHGVAPQLSPQSIGKPSVEPDPSQDDFMARTYGASFGTSTVTAERSHSSAAKFASRSEELDPAGNDFMARTYGASFGAVAASTTLAPNPSAGRSRLGKTHSGFSQKPKVESPAKGFGGLMENTYEEFEETNDPYVPEPVRAPRRSKSEGRPTRRKAAPVAVDQSTTLPPIKVPETRLGSFLRNAQSTEPSTRSTPNLGVRGELRCQRLQAKGLSLTSTGAQLTGSMPNLGMNMNRTIVARPMPSSFRAPEDYKRRPRYKDSCIPARQPASAGDMDALKARLAQKMALVDMYQASHLALGGKPTKNKLAKALASSTKNNVNVDDRVAGLRNLLLPTIQR
jgi:hypothetical protein